MSMKYRKAIITGSSRGIGLAIAKKLLEKGWEVIGFSRLFPNSLENEERFTHHAIDLSKINHLPDIFLKIAKQHHEVDTIIHNVGQGRFGNLEEFSHHQIKELMELNFLSHVFLTKTFIPFMKKQKKGNLIYIGSEAAITGKRKGSIYCATKFALRGFVQALRDELSNDGIKVCLINPGMVSTPFFDSLSFEPGKSFDESINPEDIAQLIWNILQTRNGIVLDEINLTPQKKKINHR